MIALDERLHALKEGQPERVALIELFTALAAKASEVSRIIAAGGDLGSAIGDHNADGDTQKALDELLKFPNARFDDFVDALSWIGMGLDRLSTPIGYSPRKDGVPEVGTIQWIKFDSEQRERQNFINNSSGGF